MFEQGRSVAGGAASTLNPHAAEWIGGDGDGGGGAGGGDEGSKQPAACGSRVRQYSSTVIPATQAWHWAVFAVQHKCVGPRSGDDAAPREY